MTRNRLTRDGPPSITLSDKGPIQMDPSIDRTVGECRLDQTTLPTDRSVGVPRMTPSSLKDPRVTIGIVFEWVTLGLRETFKVGSCDDNRLDMGTVNVRLLRTVRP